MPFDGIRMGPHRGPQPFRAIRLARTVARTGPHYPHVHVRVDAAVVALPPEGVRIDPPSQLTPTEIALGFCRGRGVDRAQS